MNIEFFPEPEKWADRKKRECFKKVVAAEVDGRVVVGFHMASVAHVEILERLLKELGLDGKEISWKGGGTICFIDLEVYGSSDTLGGPVPQWVREVIDTELRKQFPPKVR